MKTTASWALVAVVAVCAGRTCEARNQPEKVSFREGVLYVRGEPFFPLASWSSSAASFASGSNSGGPPCVMPRRGARPEGTALPHSDS